MRKSRSVLCVLIAMLLILMPFVFGEERAAHAQSEKLYLGGFPIGITMDVGGLLIESVSGVETDYGVAYTEGFQCGDIIVKVNGDKVGSIADMQERLDGGTVSVEVLRGGERHVVEVKPIIEAYSGLPRLGIKIKEKIYGIGTVTLVRPDGTFAALGHEIFDADTDTHLPIARGEVNGCKILGIKQGKKGEAGAILASIISDKVLGSINCNNRFGIAGKLDTCPDGELVEVCPRSEVKPGAAKIRTTVSGSPEYYDIEIVKASRQSGRKEKGLVFKVTDKKLLGITGGVVRGMSGSPIIQDGRLVGAVTHVFLNDFTRGYGVYADCLN